MAYRSKTSSRHSATSYEVLKVETFTYNGKKLRKFRNVGRMVKSKQGTGFTMFLAPEISVTGRLWIVPAGLSENELVLEYETAADEFGV